MAYRKRDRSRQGKPLKPFVKIVDIKDKVVIIRVLNGMPEDIMGLVPEAESYYQAGAKLVSITNHLVNVDVLSDKELKEMGLQRIEK